MATLQFAKIVNRVCSCGRELGILQYPIEVELRSHPDQTPETTGERLAEILTRRGIMMMCCRRTFMTAPVLMLVTADSDIFSYHTVTNELPPEMPPPTHLPFPELPTL